MKKFVGFVHEKKAQTGLEFLLIIAGAVLVVALVGYTLKSTLSAAGEQVGDNATQDITDGASGTAGAAPIPETSMNHESLELQVSTSLQPLLAS